ncbi:zinc transporter [Romboutsia sp. 1001713B170131_170501_G6]|uniref:zinc transporter n=1 Tax=Romboutsia sp. 1001713B170131_170501_G6 TaxID=2787108 RepID=UPI0018AB03E1|nr:zinc transporter [Romboutsia sp. 1001713B170131_170501_G6]
MLTNDRIKLHHADDHDHPHGHCHDHSHPHTHGSDGESKDEKTLKILLLHWVNHNESHEEGFREWVDKARAIGKEETANSIEKAIEYMQKANEMLVEAKKHM